MDFGTRLVEVEKFLRDGAISQAAIGGGQLLESVLRAVYNEILPKLPPRKAAKASAALEEVGKGKTVDELTLGQLIGVFREGGLIPLSKEKLGRDLSLLSNPQLVQGWVDLRNRAAHGGELTPEAVHVFLVNLRALFRQAGYLEAPRLGGRLPPWWEVATPHADIREGRLDPSRFAAHLDEVVAGRAGPEYADPKEFFARTYPTQGLNTLVASVFKRLSGAGGEGVIHLQTPFGGGKTHALIALFHFFRSPELLGDLEIMGGAGHALLLGEAKVAEVPKARLVTFVGVAQDPLHGRTPWGEIADQLGCYDEFRDYDERRMNPGKEKLRELLAAAPTLILMDEIAEYTAKLVDPKELLMGEEKAARAYQSQVLTFFHDLTEAVSSVPFCALVVTLTTSTAYGEEGERVQRELSRLFGRMRKVFEPVQGEEIYEVVRRRLFESLGAPAANAQVAEGFWKLYRDLEGEVAEEVRSPEYRDKIARAYPFHPELIDVLHERWGSFPEFQRTRGVLRLLAEVVAWHWQRRRPIPLIRSADVPLGQGSIRQEFLSCIGPAYESVLASDIAGGSALARRIDERLGSEFRPFRLAEGMATAIFLYSFTGAEEPERGVTLPHLRVAVLGEGLPPALIGDTLRKLEGELLYLHRREGRYFFSTEPNLNSAIVRAEEGIDDQEVQEALRELLKGRVGQELMVRLWPSRPEDVPDLCDHQLVLLGTSRIRGSEDTETFALELFRRAGMGFRNFPGGLLLLAPDAGELHAAWGKVRRLLALREVRRTTAMRLAEEDREELEHRLRAAEHDASEAVLRVFRHLGLWGRDGVEWEDLGLPSLRPGLTLGGLVIEYLRLRDRWTEQLGPEKLLAIVLKPDEPTKTYREVREMFLRVPGMPILRERALRETIREGVRQGVLGVRYEDELYFKREIPDSLLEPEAVIVRGAVVRGEVAEEGPPAMPPEAERGEAQAGVIGAPPRRYRLRVRLPWDRVADFQRGVLIPLQRDCERLELEIILEAETSLGSPPRERVREALEQLLAQGVEVLTEEEI